MLTAKETEYLIEKILSNSAFGNGIRFQGFQMLFANLTFSTCFLIGEKNVGFMAYIPVAESYDGEKEEVGRINKDKALSDNNCLIRFALSETPKNLLIFASIPLALEKAEPFFEAQDYYYGEWQKISQFINRHREFIEKVCMGNGVH